MRRLSFLRTVILAGSLATAASGMSPAFAQQTLQTDTARQAPAMSDSHACTQPNTPTLRPMRWGYYPGYGCGPVPPAETVFS
jgi:hypothetical protein